MDEEFTLVSKKKIQEYETTISQLKEELSEKNSHSLSKKDVQEIIDNSRKQTTQAISKEVSESLSQSLSTKIDKLHSTLDSKTNSKDKNDETLKSIQKEINSLHTQMQSVEKSLKTNHSETIKNLKLLVEYLQETDTIDHINTIVDTIKTHVTSTFESELENRNSQSHLEIVEKLQEIELFMTNLRVLLSYIKPSYISTSLPSPSSQQNSQSNNN
jgi:chromosome segregation ATPase